MTAADPRRSIPSGDRAADALADLADSLNGLREWFEKAQEAEEVEAQARKAKNRKREPIEWQSALNEVRDFLNGELLGHVPDGFEVSEGGKLVEDLVTALDRRLREGYYGLRQALETLSAEAPEDLRELAARQLEGVPADQRDVAVEGFVRGAVYYERG